jgi:cytochrome c
LEIRNKVLHLIWIHGAPQEPGLTSARNHQQHEVMNMKALVAAAVAAGLLSASPAFASEALAKSKNCMACHAVDKKLVGPSYKDVAAKYAGQADAAAMLADKVKKGGVGVWGKVPMPPNPQVNDADATALVEWVLSLK